MADETKRKKSTRKKSSAKKASEVVTKVDEPVVSGYVVVGDIPKPSIYDATTTVSEGEYDPKATDEGIKSVCDSLKAEPLPHTEPITADEIVNAMPQKVIHRENRVTCSVCGATMPRNLAFVVNGDQYVCSKRCLSRFATARPRF